MAIQMRRGNSINYDPSKLRAGEFAVSQDNQKVYICITQGNVLEIATSAVIEQWITEAEAWAVGERGGVPVPVTDETYHNNSKYYSERAEAASLNPPYIGQNGNWWVYSTVSEAYVDSGVDASITVNIADVTMLSAGSTPYVTNTGTSTDPIFHLFIPEARGIVSVTKTSTSGLNDTYTIAYSDNTTSTFTVTNGEDGEDGEDGRSITSITLSSRTGLVDTYTINYSDSTTSTFTVRNGNQWFNGTGVSGKSATPTVFPSSGVSYAHEQDCYLNTTEGAVYVCVTGGIASVAEWTYQFTMSGGGGGGTTNYNDLSNKPQINSHTLSGNSSLADIGLQSKSESQSGTDVSLVTTGEKYTWNHKAETSTATQSANGLMSSTDKTKLDGIASGAEVNVQSDWSQSNSSADDFIKNKPTLDSWTNIATVDSSGHVTFTGLNDSYSYSNPFINDNVARVISVARSGSGTNVTLIFALDGATQGDQCKLRVFV